MLRARLLLAILVQRLVAASQATVQTLTASAVSQSDLAESGKLAGSFIAILVFVYTLVRFMLRPLYDDSVFEAWKRRSSDVEKHLRLVVFKDDIAGHEELKRMVATSAGTAAANAAAISSLTGQINGMTQLLSGIPALSVSIDGVADALDVLRDEVRENNNLTRQNGETLAAHSALMKQPGSERRIEVRRDSDALPSSDDGA